MNTPFEQMIGIIFCLIFLPATVQAQSDSDYFFNRSSRYKDVIVERVMNTDTILLKGEIGEKGEVIKLIGLRAPGTGKKRKTDIKRDEHGLTIKEPADPATPLEEKAFDFVKELLEGQHVRLEFDDEKTDEEYQTLAYVFLVEDGT